MRERIIQLRKALKLTQAGLGKAIGITASGISDVEGGRRAVQERHIKLILSAFPQVSEKWLRSGEGEMFTTRTDVEQIIAKYSFDGICAEMMRTFADLGPEEQEIVLEYTRHFISNLLSDRAGADAENVQSGDQHSADPQFDDETKEEMEAYGRERIAEKDGQTLPVSEGGSAESA